MQVIGVNFKKNGRIYYFLNKNFDIKKNDSVIVETEKGLQFATVVIPTKEIDEQKLNAPLKQILRIATNEDNNKNDMNQRDSKEAFQKGKEIIQKHKLEMLLVDAFYNFERTQLIFSFAADNRIDFRELLKDLSSTFKIRIELRQIGIRDKAKEIGGLGPCGLHMCCSKFLNDFSNVSINMAKNQNLALNPTKINGSCGRLMCCLSYEEKLYTDLRKDLPKIGTILKEDGYSGKVINIDILKGSYKVFTENQEVIEIVLEKK